MITTIAPSVETPASLVTDVSRVRSSNENTSTRITAMISVPTRATSAASEPIPRSPSRGRNRPRSRSDPVPYLRTASLHAPNKPAHSASSPKNRVTTDRDVAPSTIATRTTDDREHLGDDEARDREPASLRRLRAIPAGREPAAIALGNCRPEVARPLPAVPPTPERLTRRVGIPARRSARGADRRSRHGSARRSGGALGPVERGTGRGDRDGELGVGRRRVGVRRWCRSGSRPPHQPPRGALREPRTWLPPSPRRCRRRRGGGGGRPASEPASATGCR